MLTNVVSQVILIVVQYVSLCMFLLQLVMSIYQYMCNTTHRRYVERGESQWKSQLQEYSTSVVDESSEMLHEKYEGLVESPLISDDREFDIYINLDMTQEQQREVNYVAKFVSDNDHEKIESRDEGILACDMSIDVMKVQQTQVSFDVRDDSSDYVIMPERNGRLNHILELLIDTQVSRKKLHPPFRLFDNVKGELRAMINIFNFVLFFSMFLWIMGCHRAFIPIGTQCDMPLVYPMEEGKFNKVKWGDTLQNAFCDIKKDLVMQPILRMADLYQPLNLQVDAYNDGLGAELLQEEEGKKSPVAYASRKFKTSKKAYAVIEKECLALVWGIQKFNRYFYCTAFTIETGHQSLSYLNKAKLSYPRLMG